jgi:shikimate kinase
MKQVLFFIGYMAAGKSHTAREMASRGDWKVGDLDEAIEQNTGRKIGAIFREDGEAAFRKMEMDVLNWLIAQSEVQIIACGGGTPCIPGALDWMKSKGHVVHLNPPFDVIARRLKLASERSHRPMLSDFHGKIKSHEDLHAHWELRKTCYARADEQIGEAPVARDFLRWEKSLD